MLNRPSGDRCSSDLPASASSTGSGASATAWAASRVKLPRNTDSRLSTRAWAGSSRSHDDSNTARMLRWRGGRLRSEAVRKSSERSISSAISCGDSTWSHAAASSTPSGIPSTRRQMRATARRVAASSAKPGRTRRALCTNSATAPYSSRAVVSPSGGKLSPWIS